MTDHTRFGYYCSLALHITVTVAAIISVLMKSIFKTDDHPIDPKQIFEMVEPAPETPVAQQPQQDDAMPQIEQQKEIAAIEPMELPEPEELEVIVAKNRHGATGSCKMAFYPGTSRVLPLSNDPRKLYRESEEFKRTRLEDKANGM